MEVKNKEKCGGKKIKQNVEVKKNKEKCGGRKNKKCRGKKKM